MKTLTKIGQAVLLLAMSASLASCGAGAPTPTPEPTVDLAVVKTSAVSTVIAEMTANAPKATATSAPTATTAATATLPVLATSASIVLPTATKTNVPYSGGGAVVATVNTYVDQGKLTYQNPIDGTVLSPGVDFDAVWTIKNIGKRDWTDQFYFMYVAGDPEGVSFDHGMLPVTKIGDSYTVTVDMVAPSEPGTYTSQWALVNDTAVKFFKFYITIVVK